MDRIVILVDTLPKGAFCYAKQLGSRGRAPSLGLILVQLNINIKYRGLLDHNMAEIGPEIEATTVIAAELMKIRRVLEDISYIMDQRWH